MSRYKEIASIRNEEEPYTDIFDVGSEEQKLLARVYDDGHTDYVDKEAVTDMEAINAIGEAMLLAFKSDFQRRRRDNMSIFKSHFDLCILCEGGKRVYDRLFDRRSRFDAAFKVMMETDYKLKEGESFLIKESDYDSNFEMRDHRVLIEGIKGELWK